MTTRPTSAASSPARRPAAATPARRPCGSAAATLTTATALLGTSLHVAAVDGCQGLLCLAAPSWRTNPQCVPTITQLLRDLARGKAFPSCAMTGGGNTADHTWASAPSHSPPQCTHVIETQGGPRYFCGYTGTVSVTINGAAFTRTWWSMDGGSITEFSPAAKAQLGRWDTQFEDDYAAWLATQPSSALSDSSAPPPEPSN